MKILKPELLSPAGSFEALRAAIENGADAVYIGGKSFSARQSAANFSNEELAEALEYCRLLNKEVYVTLNTLYKENELEKALDFAEYCNSIGVSAFIVQDIGLAQQLLKRGIKLHASTQMTAASLEDVLFLQDLGFSRVVLARELSIAEIKNICKNTTVEIECFVHGALCVSYSGQCLMSSLIGGRSGNRGRCAQCCRLPYKLCDVEGYLLSPKDMNTVTILNELIDAGITAFKIEGRMKKPQYVAGVTQIYRKYIDSGETVSAEDEKHLKQLFNRGGFTDGYYKRRGGTNMISVKRPKHWGVEIGRVMRYDSKRGIATIRTSEPLIGGDGIEIWNDSTVNKSTGSFVNQKVVKNKTFDIKVERVSPGDYVYKTNDKALTDDLTRSYSKSVVKRSINGIFTAKTGQKMHLKLYTDGYEAECSGDVPIAAVNAPCTAQAVEKQIKKMGSTPFAIDNLKIDLDDGLYISITQLNDIRRQATDKLTAEILENKKSVFAKYIPQKIEAVMKSKTEITVLVRTLEQLQAVVSSPEISCIYAEHFLFADEQCVQIIKSSATPVYMALPRIYRNHGGRSIKQIFDSSDAAQGYVVRNYGEFAGAAEYKKPIVVDYSLNICNSDAIDFWEEEICSQGRITLSVELNLKEINKIARPNCEIVVYGRIAAMITEQCPIGNFYTGRNGAHCSNKNHGEQFYLEDRLGLKFPVLTDCDECIATIYNSKIICVPSIQNQIQNACHLRLEFTTETHSDVLRVIDLYKNAPAFALEESDGSDYTKGHFFRGVE